MAYPDFFAGKGDLTADDYNYFQTQRRRIEQTRDFGLRQNQWMRDTQKLNWTQADRQLRDQYADMRRRLPSQFARGGMLNSGQYARALDQFAANRTRDLNALKQQYDQQVAGLNIADQQIAKAYEAANVDLLFGEHARRATVAEALRKATGGF